MKNKKIIICLLIMLLLSLILVCESYAIDPDLAIRGSGSSGSGSGSSGSGGGSGSNNPAIDAMSGMSGGGTVDPAAQGKLKNVINTVIGLIQMSGTGISLIMVTILGIKYIMSSPSDKADVKKQIMPMVIGCVVLFASVNLVQIIANFTENVIQ